MSALDRKLGRDLWRLKGQVATIAIVLACGIMAMVMLRSTWHSLIAARDAYYSEYRFADVSAHLERAPLSVASTLERIPGVATVYPRIVEDVMVPLADEPDPVNGRIISLPDYGRPPINDLSLRAGRMPMLGAADEAVVLEQFAEAHHLVTGDRIPVVIEGKLRSIAIVGLALSPEYVLAMSGREMVPDNRRFVVLWMLRDTIAPAFQMTGAFNDVAIRLEPGASSAAVLAAVDRELARYGALHAVPRAKQLSNHALSSELGMLRTLALIIPAMFLAVAAFLVNVVVSRMVFLERTEIAVLKALGFTTGRIARHYLTFVALIVAIAALLGVASGAWAGRWMTDLYSTFYRFPSRVHHVPSTLVAVTIGIGLVAGVAGALIAVRRIAKLPPAQAMRPAAPLTYKRTLVEHLGLGGFVGPSAMMIVREIERRPLRFAMSVLGIAMGVAIYVMGRFSWDSFDHLMSEVFPREHQEDLTVTFPHALPGRVVHELAHLPGVTIAVGMRTVPVRMRAGSRWRDTTVTGLPEPQRLRQLYDAGRRTRVVLPVQGLVVTDKLAEILGVRVGDTVEIDLLEGDWSTRTVVVGGLINEAFGLVAYARSDWLDEVLRQDPRVSAVLLQVDPADRDAVRQQLKRSPAVLSIASTEHVIQRYREQTGGSMLVVTIILTISAASIATGVVYNNARIALSMRSRDLATLRVLGFTRREVSTILLGELGAQIVLGIPLGLVLGTWWARILAAGIDPEAVRFVVQISDRTYATAALIALGSGIISALLVRHRLDHLDLVGVLKSSE